MIIPNWQVSQNIKSLIICKNDDINSIANLLPQNIFWLNQVHGNNAHNINEVNNKPYLNSKLALSNNINNFVESDYKNKLIPADASYTTLKNTACVIKTADCLPILLADMSGNWIAAIHAGWRSLLSGVIANTVLNYSNHKKNNNLIAWLGPAICQAHFEVGQEVRELFISNNQQYASYFTESKDNSSKWHADLNAIAILQLNDLCIKNIYCNNQCTYCNPELYYSYRRDNGNTGRLLSLIWKEN